MRRRGCLGGLESPPLLGASAVSALEQRRYRPAFIDGRLNFSLSEPQVPNETHFHPVLQPSGGPPKCPDGWKRKGTDCWRTCRWDADCPEGQACVCANQKDCSAAPLGADSGYGDVWDACVRYVGQKFKPWP